MQQSEQRPIGATGPAAEGMSLMKHFAGGQRPTATGSRLLELRVRMSRVLALTATVLLGTVITMVSPAAAAIREAPGWELSATSYPTNLWSGQDEIQEVTPEAGSFTLGYESEETVSMPAEASASTIQAALEALPLIGSGDVSVQRPTPAGPFTVTFRGHLGNMSLATLEGHGASTSVSTEGAASGTIEIDVFNIGARDSHGTVTVTDTLPHGLRAKEAGRLASAGYYGVRFGVAPTIEKGVWDCTGNGGGPAPGVAGATVVTCTNNPSRLATISGGGGTMTYESEPVRAEPAVGIAVEVEAGAQQGTRAGAEGNHVSITGGEALEPAQTEDPVTISPQPATAGLARADAWFSNADGTVDRQAGSHPYEATFLYTQATALKPNKNGYLLGGSIRNLETEVPAGFIGDLHNRVQCKRQQLLAEACPPSSMVGRLTVELLGFGQATMQVFNLAPPPGVPAELGFFYEAPVYIAFHVNTGGNYEIAARVNNITQYTEPFTSILTLWGTPEESSHNSWRYRAGGCSEEEEYGPPYNGSHLDYCQAVAGQVQAPFLRLPTECGAPPSFAFRELNGWRDPNAKSEIAFPMHDADDQPAGFTGCASLSFEPAITTSLDTAKADTPTGLTVEVRPPLGGLEDASGLSAADIRDTTLVLPPGLVINPGQAAGLSACGPAEDGLTSAAESARGEENDGPAHCPNSSKVGTVVIDTPLIEGDEEKQFEGNVYVLQSNPPELKLLVAASADGVNLKLVGRVSLCETAGEQLDGKTCEAPGQLISTFEDTPQLPFTDFKLSFSGGPQAALDTPVRCGTYTAAADFTPWSSPMLANVGAQSGFAITSGPEGGACPSSPPAFAPSMTAGATTDQAGGYTAFSLLLQAPDGQQRISRLQFKAPRGLSGMISRVPLCGEPQAAQGTCPAASAIGHTVVAAGPGPYPLVVPQPGQPPAQIYLTGPYEGAPFGLSIVVPVVVGPFVLQTQVVRAKIEVDPHTAQITVTTDPLPQIIDGVPTVLRSIDAVIDRPGFMFNPTNCEAQSFSGTAASAEGATAPLESHFQMGSCQSLKFAPSFKVSTAARTSRASGASLTAKIVYPTVPPVANQASSQANIAAVKVDLPRQLPSRLTTLQKACTAAQFASNPAGCPAASVVGHARVITPILPVPLTGPAYFVSHGGEAFPSLVVVLQGYGVTVQLVGTTFISSAGITSSTFASTPDVPFSLFELVLPEGKYSALTANGSLCQAKLVMPTSFKAQNGAVLKQSTPIAVEGCSDTLSVVSRRVSGRTLTLRVAVPAGGKLKAGGNGLSSVSKSAAGRETVTVTLHRKGAGKLTTKVRLSFEPAKGKARSKSVSVKFGK